MLASIKDWAGLVQPRSRRAFAIGFLLLLLASFYLHHEGGIRARIAWPSQLSATAKAYTNPRAVHINYEKVHILLPATKGDVNLCKTVLGLKILGCPTPTLISWGKDSHQQGYQGGLAHLGKVTDVLDYLNSLPTTSEHDLVVMMDAFDIVPQYSLSVLINRYRTIIERALQPFLNLPNGAQTAAAHGLFSSIVFGAGKRCAPNDLHTIACYPLPDSPLPKDIYSSWTDTAIGRNERSSARQRFLNSGYVIGPVSDLRRLLFASKSFILDTPDHNPLDGGYGVMNYAYHGSDQSVFAEILGRQEWTREALRVGLKIDRKANASEPDVRVVKSTPNLPVYVTDRKPRELKLFDSRSKSVLRPSFPHEEMDLAGFESDPSQFEFGITLDYWSEIGHQTVNSEFDGQWLVYDQRTANGQRVPLQSQITGRKPFDCKLRLLENVPQDILASHNPTSTNWTRLPLYTNLCLGTLPVFLHHNGNKNHRISQWDRNWWQPIARPLLAQAAKVASVRDFLEKQFKHDDHQIFRETEEYREHKTAPKAQLDALAWTDRGRLMLWKDLCPRDWDKEIFRDIK